MIQGFTTIIQKDFARITKYFEDKEAKSVEQNVKVTLAAARIITAIGMTFAALFALRALTFLAEAPIGAILKIAFAVGFYALSHDIFVMSKVYRNHSIMTKDTFLKPLWDQVVNQILAKN